MIESVCKSTWLQDHCHNQESIVWCSCIPAYTSSQEYFIEILCLQLSNLSQRIHVAILRSWCHQGGLLSFPFSTRILGLVFARWSWGFGISYRSFLFLKGLFLEQSKSLCQRRFLFHLWFMSFWWNVFLIWIEVLQES